MKKFGIGQPVRRSEDRRFLTGTGRYTDDISLPDQAYAYVLRSPHAHAALRGIDIKDAQASAGVLCVLTAADADADGLGVLPSYGLVANRDGRENTVPPHPVLARGRVRHVGDAVALVVADTYAQARDAAEMIEVSYEALPVVIDTAKATQADVAQVWDDQPNNTSFDWELGDAAATEAAFASAAHVVELDLFNNRLVPNSIEPRAAIGLYDSKEESYTLYATSQGAHFLRDMLAGEVFHIEAEKIRVVTPDVGGSFGSKGFLYPEYPLTMWASRKIGRPVKWTGDRSQSFTGDAQGRDYASHAALALDAGGHFLGLKVDTNANMGGYLSTAAGMMPTYVAAGHITNVYAIPAAHFAVKGVFTHTVPVDAYRGVGAAEAIYITERLVDEAARRLDVDPSELRRRNFIASDAMPYTTALDITYDSGEFARNMDEAKELIGWDDFPARCNEAKERGRLRGIGMAYYIEACGGPDMGGDEAVIRPEEDDTVTLLIGGQATGQGHETCLAQVIAERLELPMERINVRQGDTAEITVGSMTGGSRTMVTAGPAVAQASDDLLAKGRDLAAEGLEVAPQDLEFAEGRFTVAGTDRSLSLFDIAGEARRRDGGEPSNALAGVAEFTPEASTYPNGCHICEVEIDPESGSCKLVDYVVVDDFGVVVNPLLIAGQVHGGIVQGIGQSVMEDTVYDAQSGQLLTGSLMDYSVPRADDLPAMTIKWNEIPCTTNPLGVKGAGEAGAVGAPPAVINAILDALGELGITHLEMPATPERVWRAIQSAAKP